jgi:hypothetical protein
MKAGLLRTAAILLASAVPANRASAQVTPPHADSLLNFPDTSVGKLGQELIEVINSGDSAAQNAFLVGHVSDAALKEVPIADRSAWLAHVSQQSGGLEVDLAGKQVRGHGGGGPGSGISSELGWLLDGSYVVIVLGNYDLPGASAIYQKLLGFVVLQQ